MTKEQLDRANTIVNLQRHCCTLSRAYDPSSSDSSIGNAFGILYREDKKFHEEVSKSIDDLYKRLGEELKTCKPMLTDGQLKKIQFAFVSHMILSTHSTTVYKSVNTEPTIWLRTIVPRDAYRPDNLSDEEWNNRPKRSINRFFCNNGKRYAHIQTLNKHVPIKLISV